MHPRAVDVFASRIHATFPTGVATQKILHRKGYEQIMSIFTHSLGRRAMKIDVEGAEHAVLRGATRLLTEKRPLLFLSTHSPQLHAECCRLLVGLGYTLRPEVGDDIELCSEVVAQG